MMREPLLEQSALADAFSAGPQTARALGAQVKYECLQIREWQGLGK